MSPSYPKECPLLPKGQDTVERGVPLLPKGVSPSCPKECPPYPNDRIQWPEVSPPPSYPKDMIQWVEVSPSYPKECPPPTQRSVPLLPKGVSPSYPKDSIRCAVRGRDTDRALSSDIRAVSWADTKLKKR